MATTQAEGQATKMTFGRCQHRHYDGTRCSERIDIEGERIARKAGTAAMKP